MAGRRTNLNAWGREPRSEVSKPAVLIVGQKIDKPEIVALDNIPNTDRVVLLDVIPEC